MAGVTRLVFYNGRDNPTRVELLEDGILLPESSYTAMTDVQLQVRGPLGSDATVTFAMATAPTVVSTDVNAIQIDLANASPALAAGAYHGRLVTLSADYPSGLVWADWDTLHIQVRD